MTVSVIFVLLFLLYMDSLLAARSYGHEQSKIVYYNPKYVEQATAFTSRSRRGDHYKSNIAVTTRHPWGNNVTMKLLYNMQANKIDFSWKMKLCDLFKQEFIIRFLSAFSNVDFKNCPVKAMKYEYKNVEMSPKYLPMPFPSGANSLAVKFYMTDTEELILEGNMIIHVK